MRHFIEHLTKTQTKIVKNNDPNKKTNIVYSEQKTNNSKNTSQIHQRKDSKKVFYHFIEHLENIVNYYIKTT